MNLREKLVKHRELVEIGKKWEDMQVKMDSMEIQVTIEEAYNLEMLGSSPFTKEVHKAMPPKGFKLPTMKSYGGTTNPIDHLEMFRTSMSIQGADNALMCKAFLAILKKVARSWFSSLPPRSIITFKDLGKKFVSHFISSIAQKKASITLISICQRQDESLREFVTRFNNERLQVIYFYRTITIVAFTNSLRDKDFTKSLTKKQLKVFANILLRFESISLQKRPWR